MILLIDTTKKHMGKELLEQVPNYDRTKYELIDTTDMNISNCIGCNYCWLKTPGRCTIHDDYEQILKKMITARQVWLVSDTKFGFVSYQTKNIVDRVMPLVTMYLKFKDGQMRHVMRYDNSPNFGVVYTGKADAAHLAHWCERVSINFGSKSLGVYNENQLKEAAACML